jgi:hypothetical protein
MPRFRRRRRRTTTIDNRDRYSYHHVHDMKGVLHESQPVKGICDFKRTAPPPTLKEDAEDETEEHALERHALD